MEYFWRLLGPLVSNCYKFKLQIDSAEEHDDVNSRLSLVPLITKLRNRAWVMEIRGIPREGNADVDSMAKLTQPQQFPLVQDDIIVHNLWS
ncbi:hypothetical protein V6N11_012897 [Hibiscus sabdariffa]|uniref:RNase H type-1 domain-containing protein n=1 Tax=Hibiscus sabdariffa TaxID=183260 RepID=A0ABR2N961_9ROSI